MTYKEYFENLIEKLASHKLLDLKVDRCCFVALSKEFFIRESPNNIPTVIKLLENDAYALRLEQRKLDSDYIQDLIRDSETISININQNEKTV